MAVLDSLNIESFRGIKDLKISEFKSVNLVVGDNNCGKTSFLEAIQLLDAKGELSNIYKIARQRESMYFMNANSNYDNFICMFPHERDNLEIKVSGVCNGEPIGLEIIGDEKKVLLDPGELKYSTIRRNKEIGEELETDAFIGEIYYLYGNTEARREVRVNRGSGIIGPYARTPYYNKFVYVAPFEHLKGRVMSKIVRNESYKQICLKALQLFDPDIEDMMIFRSDRDNRPVEYLRHKKLGDMPLSTFGDGIKKVLVLSNAIAQANGGILLIDEIETAIHKKYYDDIFRFIVKACYSFSVQVFITTHSIEAIDGVLGTQDYDIQDEEDDINVITLKKENGKTYTRVLTGRTAAADREAFGFEVRL